MFRERRIGFNPDRDIIGRSLFVSLYCRDRFVLLVQDSRTIVPLSVVVLAAASVSLYLRVAPATVMSRCLSLGESQLLADCGL